MCNTRVSRANIPENCASIEEPTFLPRKLEIAKQHFEHSRVQNWQTRFAHTATPQPKRQPGQRMLTSFFGAAA
jgi:hypothetical protein